MGGNKILGIFFIIPICTVSSITYDASGPIWPKEYHFKGEIVDVINGQDETFEMWYSEEHNRSRIDYYEGTVQKYYIAPWGGHPGLMITLYPATIDMVNYEIMCDAAPRREQPYNILPDDDVEWTYDGTEKFMNKDLDVWKREEIRNKTSIEEIIYTFKEAEDGVDIPFRKITKKFNWWRGKMVKHHIASFYDYQSNITLEIVDVEKSKCREIPWMSLDDGLKYLRPDIPNDLDVAFDRYKAHHSKNYEEDEHEMRKEIFEDNWRRVESHNKKDLGYKLELNEFADYTDEELIYLTGALPSETRHPGTHPFPHTLEEIMDAIDELPDELDLRLEGVVPPVKHQLACGSCWAFATTAAVEVATIQRRGRGVQLDLSEQSLVDCSWKYHNFGCDGGLPEHAMEYIRTYGLPTEEQYGGYIANDGYCHVKNASKTYSIYGFTQVPPRSAEALKFALNKYGAVTVTLYASENMLLYASGLFYDMTCEGNYLNHAVVVVGYGISHGEPYWIVRNSWGQSWGEDGYILMVAKDNNCLILDSPYYPILK